MDKKTYKNLIILSIGLALVLILIIVLFARDRSNKNIYSGFLKPEKGAWSELMNGAEKVHKIVYLGEQNIHNVLAYGVEIESIVSANESAITQVWRDKESDEIVEIVTKLKGKNEVICVDSSLMEIFIPSFSSTLPAIETPEKYSLNNKYTYDTFTTKLGKTIQIAKFIDENDMEIWISSEVPFGIVKIANHTTGEIIAYLQDFDLSGGQQEISKSEMLNCKKMNFPNLPK